MKNVINLVVGKNVTKKRVDMFIFENFKDLSRSRIKNLILEKKLKINGKINISASKYVKNGDKIF